MDVKYFKLHSQYTLPDYGDKQKSNLVICCYDEEEEEVTVIPDSTNTNCVFDSDIYDELGLDLNPVADFLTKNAADPNQKSALKTYSKNFEYRLILAAFLFLKKRGVILDKSFANVGNSWDSKILNNKDFTENYFSTAANNVSRLERVNIEKILRQFGAAQSVKLGNDNYFGRLSTFTGSLVEDYVKKRDIKVEFKSDMMLHLKLTVPAKLLMQSLKKK